MIPDIYCEATELLKLPALSLDPVSDQVHSNSKSLETLICTVGSLEKKLSTFISSSSSLSNFGVNVDGCSSSAGSTSTFATVASKPVKISPPSVDSPLPLHQTMSVRQPMQLGSRDLNVVLFGLPENGSIVDDKRIVDEALEFLVDMAVDIRDMFRQLGIGSLSFFVRIDYLTLELNGCLYTRMFLLSTNSVREGPDH